MAQLRGVAILRTTTVFVAATGFLVLAGCTEDGSQSALNSGATSEKTAPKPKLGKSVEQNVPAPEVFQVAEAGLWDGRPSLGGIWVAHPDVKDPERVLIRNEANGEEITGALFRRQRDIPGPRLQASSDAADALGMLPGAPVKLTVTALRREVVQEETDFETEPRDVVEVTRLQEDAEISATAIDASPAQSKPAAGEATAIAAAAATTTAAAVDGAEDVVKPRKKTGWFGRKKAEEQLEEETVALEDAPLAEAAVDDTTDDVDEAVLDALESDGITDIDTPEKKPFKWPWQKKKDAQTEASDANQDDLAAAVSATLSETRVETTELPQVASEPLVVASLSEELTEAAVPSAPKKKKTGWFRKREPQTPDALTETPTETAGQVAEEPFEITAIEPAKQETAQPRGASSLDRPYIQVGVFGVESNATRTASQMRAAGIVPAVREGSTGGRKVWRVVVGPARDKKERTALLQQVKDTGFGDAYAVRN